jgi:type IV secretion system protein VirB10
MTARDQDGPARPGAKVAPETLELRARPQPVTRINRKVVIGAAAVLLFLISCIVLVALKPPSLRMTNPQELFNVDHKPITDALSRLPATYDGIRVEKKADSAKEPASTLPPGVPHLSAPASDPVAEAERLEKARLARMAGQARESAVFFRLQLKSPQRETVTTETRPDPIPRPSPTSGEGTLATLSALRAAERAFTLGGGDIDLIGTSGSDQTRKLSFLKSGPENLDR